MSVVQDPIFQLREFIRKQTQVFNAEESKLVQTQEKLQFKLDSFAANPPTQDSAIERKKGTIINLRNDLEVLRPEQVERAAQINAAQERLNELEQTRIVNPVINTVQESPASSAPTQNNSNLPLIILGGLGLALLL